MSFVGWRTLWFNTGTLCNIACTGCYIESTPTNDRLIYLAPGDIAPFLDELDRAGVTPLEIGFTGGEPFANPWIIDLLGLALDRGHRLLVLTNAMRPMMRPRVQAGLLLLRARHGDRLMLRVSLDHHAARAHDSVRGEGSFAEAVAGLDWLQAGGFALALAGRTLWEEDEAASRAGYAALVQDRGWAIDTADPARLVLFPEMRPREDVPEITPACWGILDVRPQSLMCASSRMVVRRKGTAAAEVVACTLLPYEPQFSLGASLAAATEAPVPLNHRFCAQFCVLGGGSCS